jgi:hypothetical protein
MLVPAYSTSSAGVVATSPISGRRVPLLPALARRVLCAHSTRAVRRAGLWIVLLVPGLHSARELYRSETASPAGRQHGGRLRAGPR